VPDEREFPPRFLWGASTSSHQVEGGNRWNDWWEYEQAGRLPFRSGDACRHYELFEADFDLARAWAHNAHRFSIEWSRLEPEPGAWNKDAASHYVAVVQALRERGLEPVVTLNHFTVPAWSLRRGGWLRRDSVRFFARYVERIAGVLGGAVKYWLTLNEPTVYVMQAYIAAEWPPLGRRQWRNAATVLRRLARAHVAAADVLHRLVPGAQVSFAHNAPFIAPCNPARWRDRMAAAARDAVLNGLFFQLIGASPRRGRRGPLDFIAINYYSRTVVRSRGFGITALVGSTCDLAHHPDRGPSSMIGWEIYPDGLRAILHRFARYGLPILITENGVATEDEAQRQEFIHAHIAAVHRAMLEGVPVFGYLYWSLIDNYEWAMGTRPRFGLAAVDYETGRRTPRPCTVEFSRICRANRL
jgi:beta-glucosidase